MKKIKFIVFILVMAFLFLAQNTLAVGTGMDKPFGGMITTITMPPIQCPTGEGPILIRPVGSSIAGLYSTNAASRSWVGTLTPGAWILGFYSQTMSQECFIQVGYYRFTVSTYPITQYGTSSGGGF